MKKDFPNLREVSIRALCLCVLIFCLSFSPKAFAVKSIQSNQTEKIVIEHLRLSVPAVNRQAWLDAESKSWGPWLQNQKGFLGRQLLWDKQNEEAIVLISWATRSDWKSIPQSEIEEVQELFEELARKNTSQQVDNPFPLQFEGELVPQ